MPGLVLKETCNNTVEEKKTMGPIFLMHIDAKIFIEFLHV